MSRITVILGSGRRGGNSEATTEALLSSLNSGSEHSITRYRLADMEIGHCMGCNSCRNDGICIMRDDMDLIYRSINDTDLLIVSTPIYFSGPSSLIKQVIDRCQSIWNPGSFPDKRMKGFLVAVSGQHDANFRNTRSIVKSMFNTIGAEWMGELILPGYDGIGDFETDGSAVEKAVSWGKELNRSLSSPE